jgi:hypothetical protein
VPKKPKKTWKSPITTERSAEWLRRSAASRLGWQRKKKRELPKKIARTKKLIHNANKNIVDTLEANPRIGSKRAREKAQRELDKETLRAQMRGKSVKQLERMLLFKIAALSKKQKEIDILTLSATFTEFGASLAWRNNFGAIALEYCSLRTLGEVQDVKKMLEVASGNNFGVLAINLSKRDRRNLKLKAMEISEAYDVPLREVYTLFYSP